MCDNQFKVIEDIINTFEKNKITELEAIGIMEILKYQLLKGDI